MTRPPSSLLRRVGAVVLVTAALGGASAASLGGVHAGGLGAWVLDVDIDVEPPPPVGCTGFDLSGSLDGQSAGCGATWTMTGGNWHTVGGRLKANATEAIAWIQGPSPYLTAEVDVFGAGKKSRVGGLVISYDPADGSHLAAVLVGPDRIELRATTLSSTTVLTSATVSLSGNDRLRISRNSTSVTVSVGANAPLTFELGASVFAGTAAGLYHDGGPAVEFDNYILTVT